MTDEEALAAAIEAVVPQHLGDVARHVMSSAICAAWDLAVAHGRETAVEAIEAAIVAYINRDGVSALDIAQVEGLAKAIVIIRGDSHDLA